MMSIAQDLIRCISGGRVETPNQVLPVIFKHLMRCCQLVEILNRLRHALSNNQISGVETGMASRNIKNFADDSLHTS